MSADAPTTLLVSAAMLNEHVPEVDPLIENTAPEACGPDGDTLQGPDEIVTKTGIVETVPTATAAGFDKVAVAVIESAPPTIIVGEETTAVT